MNEIEKKLDQKASDRSVDAYESRKGKEKKIIDESRKSSLNLAEQVFLSPVRKNLELLKTKIFPKKIQQEIHEHITSLEKDKQYNEKKVITVSKHDLDQFKANLSIPSYYQEYAKKGPVAKAQSNAAQLLIRDISEKDPNPVVDFFRKIAQRSLS